MQTDWREIKPCRLYLSWNSYHFIVLHAILCQHLSGRQQLNAGLRTFPLPLTRVTWSSRLALEMLRNTSSGVISILKFPAEKRCVNVHPWDKRSHYLPVIWSLFRRAAITLIQLTCKLQPILVSTDNVTDQQQIRDDAGRQASMHGGIVTSWQDAPVLKYEKRFAVIKKVLRETLQDLPHKIKH